MEFWQKYIVENFYKPFSGVILGAVSLPILEAINQLLKGFGMDTTARAAISTVLFVVTILSWLYGYLRLPRNRKDRIGIVVSLYCENKEQEICLKNDFLRELKLKLAGLEEVKCHFICLPNHKAEKIAHSEKPEALCAHWNKKIGGHYFVYGVIKQRQEGSSKYFVDLAGLVTHAPVPLEVSTTIRNDFNRILPNNVSFEEAFELGGFTLTADLVSHSVKLIVGIAAMVSGDLFLAHQLHSALLQEAGTIPKEVVGRWKDRLDRFIDDEENFIAIYFDNKDNAEESKKWLARLLQRSSRHYGGLLLRAIHQFRENRVNAAVNSVKQARQYARTTHEWKYSLAFLLFWQGQFDEALDVCYSIQKSTYPGEEKTARQVSDFIQKQLQSHPSKAELYYWLGFVQYKKLGNLPGSLQSFEAFLRAGDRPMKKMRERAEAYLVEIKREGGWS